MADDVTRYQRVYWVEMFQLRTHLYYLNRFNLSYKRWQSALDGFLAVASSASIGGWLIWSKYQMVWAITIGLSNLITAIKAQLPFWKRDGIIAASAKLSNVALKAEDNWFQVSEGLLTNEQINELTTDIKKEINGIETEHLVNEPLPTRASFLVEAQENAERYFRQRLCVQKGETDDQRE